MFRTCLGHDQTATDPSWILRCGLKGRSREKVIGRCPELSLKDAREQLRRHRAPTEFVIDGSAARQAEEAMVLEVPDVQRLGDVWFARYNHVQPASLQAPGGGGPRAAQAHPSGTRAGRAF
jgi:hypothetical protein